MLGVREDSVHSREGMLQCLEAGSACRTTGSTLMNEQSSRSHSLFTVLAYHPSPRPNPSPPPNPSRNHNPNPHPTPNPNQVLVERRAAKAADTVRSKFHLVDLAGSERNKKTGAAGQRFKESVTINQVRPEP